MFVAECERWPEGAGMRCKDIVLRALHPQIARPACWRRPLVGQHAQAMQHALQATLNNREIVSIAARVAAELPGTTLQSVLISPVLSHLNLDGAQPSAVDRWRLVHFFALILRDAHKR